MTNIDSIYADLLSQRETAHTLIALADLLRQQPDAAIAAFNSREWQERKHILDACCRSPHLSYDLLRIWLEYLELIDSRNLQRYLCDLIEQMAASEGAYWQQRSTELDDQLACAVAALAGVQVSQQQHIHMQQRYISLQEEISVLQQLEQETATMRAAIDHLEHTSLPECRHELDQLREQRQQLEQTSWQFDAERDQLEAAITRARAEVERKKVLVEHQLRDDLSKLRKYLDEVEDFSKRLDNPPTDTLISSDLQQEMNELKRLLIDKELRQRVDRVYRQWHELTQQPT